MLMHYLKLKILCLLVLTMANTYAVNNSLNVELKISEYLAISIDEIKIKKMPGMENISLSNVVKSKVDCLKGLGRCSIVAQIITPLGYTVTSINWYEIFTLTQSPTLKKSVKEGEEYDASKVVFNEEFTRLGTCPDKLELASSEFIKSFGKGDRITSRMLRKRMIVEIGDEVVVKYIDKYISVEANAIALSSGALGSEINIVRGPGEKAFRAMIVGPKLLEVKI
jgi:hypothetical protein